MSAYERIVRRAMRFLGLPAAAGGLTKLPKSDVNKVVVAALLRERTSVGNAWIAERLAMGHPGSVSRMIGSRAGSAELAALGKKPAKALDEA